MTVYTHLISVDQLKALQASGAPLRVVDCSFEDCKNGQYKIISFYAKKARGLMARWAIAHQAKTPAALQKFDTDGYAYASDVSTPDHLVFRRKVL